MHIVLDDPHVIYFHLRILLGVVVGLGLTHLLRGIAQIIENPQRKPIYWLHLMWVLSMLIYFAHFWWWELQLVAVTIWSFHIYVFLLLYALLLYLLASLLFPGDMQDYADYKTYFYSRKAWFFAILALTYGVDFIDTWLKGHAYVANLGVEYSIRNISYMLLCAIGIATRNVWFHAAFAIIGVLYQLSWIIRMYAVIS